MAIEHEAERREPRAVYYWRGVKEDKDGHDDLNNVMDLADISLGDVGERRRQERLSWRTVPGAQAERCKCPRWLSEHIDSISLNPDVAIATTLRVTQAEVEVFKPMPSA